MDKLLDARADKLLFYSPYNFIRDISIDKQLNLLVYPSLKDSKALTYEVTLNNQNHVFVYEHLSWDSDYFNLNTYKLKGVLFSDHNIDQLTEAIKQFRNEALPIGSYVFLEIPSEDILLLQALGRAGFQLVETRLTYFRGNLNDFNEPRYPVRKATISDIDNLKLVACQMRNDYDRFHADPIFNQEIADNFLATYIEQSLKGFADIVLTSNEDQIPSDSFLTAKYLKSDWDILGTKVSKMVLSAVSNKTNKGWYKKLISEMTYHLREQGAEYIFLNTQSTNRAVFYTWEKLGYKLGATTHILSYSK
ncbi:MAG: hypothetical protein KBE91_07515 [Bacteroidia bacterium]|nr:hypothetical protein [Bacteroidia bacterium]MBP9689441.1 hypothetical protein [Bacteroidia bacterium]